MAALVVLTRTGTIRQVLARMRHAHRDVPQQPEPPKPAGGEGPGSPDVWLAGLRLGG